MTASRSRVYVPLAVFGLLAAVILGPLLAPGYVLTFDMVFVPHPPLPASVGVDYPFWVLLHFASLAIPGWLVQKVLLLAMLTGSGYGAYRMAGALRPPEAYAKDWRWGSYVAGSLYMFNPFVYDRFMAGQYMVLLGYALLPVVFMALWRWLQEPTARRGIVVALLVTVLGIVSVHAIGFALLIALAVTALWAWRRRNDAAWRRSFLMTSAIATGVWAAVNSYWIMSLLSGHSAAGGVVQGFGVGDLRAFATVPGHLGIVGNVLALQGFWGDTRNLYLLPQDMLGWWWLYLVPLFGLVAAGLLWTWRRQRGVAVLMIGLLVTSGVMAAGAHGTPFSPVMQWLFDHVSLARGYREPQKWAAVLVLAYSYLVCAGLYGLLEYIHSRRWSADVRHVVILASFGMVVASAPLMPFGFHGQLHVTQYPADWYRVQAYLERHGNQRVVFLPWHLYMRYGFVQRVAASPAPKFFGSQVTASSDPEMRGASPYSQSAVQRDLTAWNQRLVSAAGGSWAAWHVGYVLLAKEHDWHRYDDLQKDTRLQVVMDTPALRLYKVKGD